jgi:hypothetical protein
MSSRNSRPKLFIRKLLIRLAQLELILGFELSDGIDDFACACLVLLDRSGQREVEELVSGKLDLGIIPFQWFS